MRPEQVARKRRVFLETIQPWIKLKADIYARTMPSMIISESGIEMEYHFSEDQNQALAEIEEVILSIYGSVFGPLEPKESRE